MRHTSAARYPHGVPCAAGCGLLADAGGIYCGGCAAAPVGPQEAPDDLDVDVAILSERLAGGGPVTRRLAKYGASKCRLCGRDALPGRLYCSGRCRGRARHGQPARIEVDGVLATPREHAVRRGISASTFYGRLQLGLSPEEALTKPVRRSA